MKNSVIFILLVLLLCAGSCKKGETGDPTDGDGDSASAFSGSSASSSSSSSTSSGTSSSFSSVSSSSSSSSLPVGVASVYTTADRTLLIYSNASLRWKFIFNPGGAINGIYDMQIAPANNLVASSFQGETTDRVIQWTYWNRRYLCYDHGIGSGDRRANATMEGGWGDWVIASINSSPTDTTSGTISFISTIESWFYSNGNASGTPDFETTSTYEVLSDGSLKLTRQILRRDWTMVNFWFEDGVGPISYQGRQYSFRAGPESMACTNLGIASITSYLEGWTPFKQTYLPDIETQSYAVMDTTDGGHYDFHDPGALGGWIMAKSSTLGVAVIFGTTRNGVGDLRMSVNNIYLNNASPNDLNIFLPCVDATWPVNYTLTQTLIFTVGTPAEVRIRANNLVSSVPVATVN